MENIFALGIAFFEQFWKPLGHGTIMPGLVEIGQDVFLQDDVLSSIYNL
jgi:hypothetical protein